MKVIKLGFLSLFLLSYISIDAAFALSPPVDSGLKYSGKINITSGVNGNEIIEIASLSSQSDRLAFFSANQAYRFELLSGTTLQAGQLSKFEFDRFGAYICSGSLTINSAEYANVIALAGVTAPLLSLKLSFEGGCRISDDLFQKFTGTLDLTTSEEEENCIDLKDTNESLNQQVADLTAQISDLIQERDDALELAAKSILERKNIKKLILKTNPQSVISLKSLYTQLKRIYSPLK